MEFFIATFVAGLMGGAWLRDWLVNYGPRQILETVIAHRNEIQEFSNQRREDLVANEAKITALEEDLTVRSSCEASLREENRSLQTRLADAESKWTEGRNKWIRDCQELASKDAEIKKKDSEIESLKTDRDRIFAEKKAVVNMLYGHYPTAVF